MRGFRDLFMTAQEAVAIGLSESGVKVVFDARKPNADLQNRVMHLRPLPQHIDAESLEDCRGDADHETGHFRYTDVEALKEAAKDGCPFLRLIINVIEDGRIERLVSDEWFGCAENLENSGLRAVKKMLLAGDGSEDHRRRRAMCALTMLSFGRSLEYVLNILGSDIACCLNRLGRLGEGLSELSSTTDVVTRAKAIRDVWYEWSEESRGRENHTGESEQDDDPGSAGVSGGDDSIKPRDKKKGKKGKKNSPTTDEKIGNGVKASQSEESIRDLAARMEGSSIADMRKHSISSLEFPEDGRYCAFTALDVVGDISVKDLAWAKDSRFTKGVRAVLPSMRRRIVMEFQGAGENFARNQRRGRLDDRALFKVGLGSDRVFSRSIPAMQTNSFIQLLVDASGSMRNPCSGCDSKIWVASQCASAMSNTLDSIGVDHECLAFTTVRDFKFEDVEDALNSGMYHRITPLNHLVIKGSNERWHQARRRFPALATYYYQAENIDGEALLWSASRIVNTAKDGAKPLIIVLSDGEPYSRIEHEGTLRANLISTIARIEGAGIPIVGVGIGTDCVNAFYDNHAVVDDLEDMAELFFGMIRRVLRETSVIRR